MTSAPHHPALRSNLRRAGQALVVYRRRINSACSGPRATIGSCRLWNVQWSRASQQRKALHAWLSCLHLSQVPRKQLDHQLGKRALEVLFHRVSGLAW